MHSNFSWLQSLIYHEFLFQIADAKKAKEEEERKIREKAAAEAAAAAAAAQAAAAAAAAQKAAAEAAAAEAAARAVKVEIKVEEEEEEEDEEEQTSQAPGFSWGRYLDATNAKAAPTKLFSTGIPDRPNPFRVGMKMEAIDPEHPALFCCVTVVETKGMSYYFTQLSKCFGIFWIPMPCH